MKEWLKPLIESVDAHVLVTDDSDALKTAADENGVYQQVCKSHVGRNTDALVEQLQASLANGVNASLTEVGVSVQQALTDLHRLKELIPLRQPEARSELESMAQRYLKVKPSPKGQPASLAYCLRNLLWPRLTFYSNWKDSSEHLILDGINNATERSIGWWIKERYRSMRGYKCEQSALNISRLIAYAGSHSQNGLNLTSLIA